MALLSCCLFVTFDPILDIIANNVSEASALVKSQINSFFFHTQVLVAMPC